jgi:hypothetical protein
MGHVTDLAGWATLGRSQPTVQLYLLIIYILLVFSAPVNNRVYKIV